MYSISVNQLLPRNAVSCLSRIQLEGIYIAVYEEMLDKRLNRGDLMSLGFSNLHEFLLSVLPSIFDSMVTESDVGKYPSVVEAFTNLGFTTEESINLIDKISIIFNNQFFYSINEGISLNNKKLFIYIDEDESLFPYAYLNYVNTE